MLKPIPFKQKLNLITGTLQGGHKYPFSADKKTLAQEAKSCMASLTASQLVSKSRLTGYDQFQPSSKTQVQEQRLSRQHDPALP